MSDSLDDIMAKALSASKDLEKLGSKVYAENAIHLDKVDPKIRDQFEKEGKNIESLNKELKDRLKELDNLKHKL